MNYAEYTTPSGLKIKLTQRNIIVGESEYRFTNPFEMEIKNISASISGHFVSAITNEGQMFLFTCAAKGSLYVDYLSSSDTYEFSAFTCDETKLVALTQHNTLHYFKVLPNEFIKEFSFDSDFQAIKFSLIEANGVVQITGEDGSSICLNLPVSFDSAEPITMLTRADDSLLSVFDPLGIIQAPTEEVEGPIVEEIDVMPSPSNPSEAVQMLLERSKKLNERQHQLVDRRNKAANDMNQLYRRGKAIREREERARAKAQELFARIQALIERSDASDEVMQLEAAYQRAKGVVESANVGPIPESENDPSAMIDGSAVLAFHSLNMRERLAALRSEVDRRVEESMNSR